MNKRKIFYSISLITAGILMLAGVSSAATTIGTNITTQGTLAVTGASTLTGATTITGLLTTNGDITLSNGATAVNTSADLLTITEASITLAATATTTASGDIYVTKSIKVGNGTPTVTLNGEDVYIEGTLEVDGAVRFDSTLEVNNTITLKSNDTIKNDTASTTIMSGILQLTGDLDVNGTASSSIAGDLYVTKAFKVGDGTPDLGLNLEDAYVEGSLEVDGAVRFDGNLTVAGTFSPTDFNPSGSATIGTTLSVGGNITLQSSDTIKNTSASTTIMSGILQLTGDLDVNGTASSSIAGDLYVTKAFKVGDGTPDLGLNLEDAYVEGSLEVDGAVRFDGNLTVNGTASSSIAGDLYVTKAFKVGDGTPDLGLNLEDAYIEGSLEVDGAVRFDGTVTANGLIIDSAGILEQTADITSDLTASELGNHILVFQDTVDDAITLTFGGDILADVIPDGGSVEYIFINESGGIITIGADQNATILSTDKTIADNEFARITVFRIGALYWVFMNVPVALDAGDVT